MKTTNLLIKTAVLTACFLSAGLAAAGPLDPTTMQKIAKAIRASRTNRGINRRFSFPEKTTARIRAGIREGRLKPVITQETMEYSPVPVPTPLILGAPKDMTFALQQMIGSVPVEKEILVFDLKESQFYAPEYEAATNLYNLVSNIKTLDEKTVDALVTSISQDLKNHSLQTYLLQSLSKQDLYMFKLDLADYFSTGDSVEIAAFNYTLRHPHQQTLMMRRLLNNPLVDEEHKETLRAFLNKPKIKPAEFPAFQAAISKIYSQYHERLAAATETDVIQLQIDYMAQLIDRLGDFMATSPNNRRPKWNTLNKKEQDLFDEIEWVQTHQDLNQLEPLLAYQRALNMVWDSAEPTYLTQEETLELFKDFVRVTKRKYPCSLRNKLKPGDIPFRREEELWDNVAHWQIEDPSFFSRITQTYNETVGK